MSSTASTIRPSHSQRSSRLKAAAERQASPAREFLTSNTGHGTRSASSRDSRLDTERVDSRQRSARHNSSKLNPPHTKDLSGVSALTNYLRPHPAINSSTGFPYSTPLVYEPPRDSSSNGRPSEASAPERAATPRREGRHRDTPRTAARTKASSMTSTPTKPRNRGDTFLKPELTSGELTEVPLPGVDRPKANVPTSLHRIHSSPSRKTASDITAVAESLSRPNSPKSHKKNISSGSSVLSSTLSAAYK